MGKMALEIFLAVVVSKAWQENP